MNIYLRKILKHDITHQISVTKEILHGFFGVNEEKAFTKVTGKKSEFTGTVTFLLSTDPRFGGDIKQIINNEGGMNEDDILLFVKSKNGYLLEIITKTDSRHDTFIKIMEEERHLIVNVDDEGALDNDVFNRNVYASNTENIFLGFDSWLTSYDNPDYTGTQKYANYAKALIKLINFMFEQKLIDDSDLNDKCIDKYVSWLAAYNTSDAAKEYDEKKLSSRAGSAALKKYIKYVEFLLAPRAEVFDYTKTYGQGINKIFYGTPGCGKSHHIRKNILEMQKYAADNVIRTTFYQDYSNTDFVGQILPKIVKDAATGNETVKYIFNPGPFTLALIRAIEHPTEKVALVIEEINRGNAPAIFGDIFQLLDRDSGCVSEYGIVNVSVLDYLNDYLFEVNGEKKNYIFKEIKIPGNMSIYATMNTSDQNVYTLDTAFVRRWDKEKVKNSFADCTFADTNVPGMNYTWREFVTAINNHIAKHLEDLQINEDKQLGVFFVKERLLQDSSEKFAYKVLDYLWSDVSKLDHGVFFNHFNTLEALITAYVKEGVGVFQPGIFDKKETPQTAEEDENHE